MNIGMVVDNELDGDVRVRNEAYSLARAGFGVFILCLARGGSPHTEKREGYTVVRIPRGKKWRNKTFFFANIIPLFHNYWRLALKAFIKSYHIDVIHAHDLYMARSACEAARQQDIPWVLDLHENFPEAVKGYRWASKFPNRWVTRPWRWEKFEEKYLPKADRVVLLSENFKNRLLQKYPALAKEKMVVYSNVPDVEALQSYPSDKDILPEKGNSKVLFYFGGIAQRRGIYTLIEAHQQLLQKGYDVKLLLIGPADKAEKSQFLQAIEEGVKVGTIIYHEWKEMVDLPSYIQASDICVSPILKNPQHESGIANKVFQYMLFERPVVVSDSKPQKDLVEEGGCGLAFRSEDVEDLAAKTAWLLDHPQEAKEMGEHGEKLVKEKYNSKVMARNLEEMYKKNGADV